jgi:hypothetical protein
MKSQTRRIACFCEATFDAQIPSSADLGADPDVEELILDGSFMSVTCPACSKRLTPEYPFRLGGVPVVGELFLVPEMDRAAYERGRLEYEVGSPGRVCVGFPELAEKVLIFGRGLDDRVIEIMKFYLLTGSGAPPSAEGEVYALYRGLEDGRHLFNIVGLREGEVGVARLAEGLYGKIAADLPQRLAEEPFNAFCAPPWVSLRRAAEGKE